MGGNDGSGILKCCLALCMVYDPGTTAHNTGSGNRHKASDVVIILFISFSFLFLS